jgi:peptidoglycan/xylan/chitin deacetylase (PgdA/CDA1 family)
MRRVAALLLVLLASTATAQLVPILGYHEVDAAPERGWSVRTDEFRDQLQYLAATGHTVIPIEDLVNFIHGRRDSLPPRPVVITVDDGWICTYTEMNAPLQELKFPYSVYIYPKIVGQGLHAMKWLQIKDLAAHGVDIQSHTVSHAHLMRRSHPDMDDAKYGDFLRHELASSRLMIEHQVGHSVTVLAYPYGDHDKKVEDEAAKAGYEGALTSEVGLNSKSTNPMKLRRIPVVSATTMDQFLGGIGDGILKLSNTSLPNEGVLATDAKTIDATLENPARYTNLHATLLGGGGEASCDAATGRVTITLTKPLAAGRHRVVVWADEVTTSRRAAAVWTFYTSLTEKARYEAMQKQLGDLPLHHGATSGPGR